MCLISYSTCAVMKFFFVLGSIGDLFSSFGNCHLVSCFLFSLSNLAISTLPRRWQVLYLFFHMTISTFIFISPSFVAVIASTITLPSPLGPVIGLGLQQVLFFVIS
jgi:hypothetical protein